MNDTQWTKSKARLSRINSEGQSSLTWIFIPGGPGLGSECFASLTKRLKLPGEVWHFDFPGDGSNRLKDFSGDTWKQSLLEAAALFEHPILVAHSFGGMFALSLPELEKSLGGLVLMNSAPSLECSTLFNEYLNEHPDPDFKKAELEYANHPSDQSLKALVHAVAPYFFTKSGLSEGLELLAGLPYTHGTYEWVINYFYPIYEVKLNLEHFPILVMGSEFDVLTPLKLFSKDPRFARDNIQIIELKGASHFPWVGNLAPVEEALGNFAKVLAIGR